MTDTAPKPNMPVAPVPRNIYRLIGAALILLYDAVLAFTPRIDGDEAYFIYAAWLVLQGEIPYLDFHYPQWPFLPYFWAALLAPMGEITWITARTAAMLVASAGAICLWFALKRRVQNSWVLLWLML